MKKVILMIFTILLLIPLSSQAADLFMMPQNLEVYPEDNFMVEILINSNKKINAIETEITWPTDKLILENISNGGSVFDLWVTKPTIEQTGKINIIAGSTKGFQGKNFKVANLFFRTKNKLGNFSINFNKQTKILKADGKATAVTVKLLPVNYNLIPKSGYIPVITSKNQPNENLWYSNPNFDVHWSENSGYSYSYLLSQDQLAIPDENLEKTLYNIKYKNLKDGIYYFHLRTKDKNNNWSAKITRQVMIDATKPKYLKVVITKNDKYFGLSNSLVFSAYDETSGIRNFQIKYPNQSWQTITSPYQIEKKWFNQKVIVRVFDQAGNFLDKSIELPGIFNWQLVLIFLAFILAFILIIYLIFRRRYAHF